MGKSLGALTLGLSLLLASCVANAVAYCSLRDPVNTIYELFPEADGYRSSVRTVGRTAREAVVEALALEIHFNELGRHTLYIAQRDGRPLGFVHARSESSRWGLTEFAWAISADQRIVGMKVQRSRDRELRGDRATPYQAMVVGKDVAALQALYESSRPDSIDRIVIASALKTLVITGEVWAEEVLHAQSGTADAPKLVQQHFDEPVRFERLSNPYTAKVRAQLDALDLAESPIFLREQLQMFRVLGEQGAPLGLVVRTQFDLENPKRMVDWVLDRHGRVLSVATPGASKPHEAFLSVIDYLPRQMKDCTSAAELGAFELGVVARQHLGG